VIAYRVIERNPAHVHVAIYSGKEEGHLAFSGNLTFDTDRWDAEYGILFFAAGFEELDAKPPKPPVESYEIRTARGKTLTVHGSRDEAEEALAALRAGARSADVSWQERETMLGARVYLASDATNAGR